MPEPEWNDFHVMLALAESGSIAGAARVLGIDGSTVSRRLAIMEEVVGAVLILRGGRVFTITPEGQSAVEAARAMQTAAQDALLHIRAAKQAIEGTVQVACPSGMIQMLLPIVPFIQAKYPLLNIVFSADNNPVDLSKGDADLAFRSGKITAPDLIARKSISVGWAVYTSKAYASTHGLPTTLEELKNHLLILYLPALQSVMPGFSWLENYCDQSTAVSRMNGTDSTMRMVALGHGIAALPCCMADAETDFVRVFPEPFFSGPFSVVYHESQRNTAKVKMVADALVEYIATKAHVFSGLRK